MSQGRGPPIRTSAWPSRRSTRCRNGPVWWRSSVACPMAMAVLRLEPRGNQTYICMLPGSLEALIDSESVLLAPLCAHRRRHPEQRPAIFRIALQLLLVHRLGICRLAGGQQRFTQGMSHRRMPAGRFVIGNRILDFDRLAQLCDSGLEVAAGGGDVRAQAARSDAR